MNELIERIVSQLGINRDQAQGGAGLLFKLARKKLGGDFSGLADLLDGVEDLIQKAPEASSGGMGSLLGGIANAVGGEKLGNLAELAAGFKQLKLDPEMIGKFIPLVLEYVRGKGGDQAVDLLKKVLQ